MGPPLKPLLKTPLELFGVYCNTPYNVYAASSLEGIVRTHDEPLYARQQPPSGYGPGLRKLSVVDCIRMSRARETRS